MAIRRCRISGKQPIRLIELFVAGVMARTAVDLAGLHRNSAALFYPKLRQLIANKIAEIDPEFGAFEADESYFGGWRKGRRGRGAAGKVVVFGILKRGGKVPALPVADASGPTLLTALQTRVLADSVVYTDSLPSHNILDVAGFKHRRVNHSKTFVSKCGHHINASRTSGTGPSVCSADTMASRANTSICSLRNASSVSTTDHQNSNLPNSADGLTSNPYLGQPLQLSGWQRQGNRAP